MNTHSQYYRNYLNSEKELLKERIRALSDDQRNDETNHVKIELNIVEIFEKMFDISEKKAINNQSELINTYLTFFDKIPSAWHESLAKSLQHGDATTAFIEQLKIAKANSLKSQFEVLFNA